MILNTQTINITTLPPQASPPPSNSLSDCSDCELIFTYTPYVISFTPSGQLTNTRGVSITSNRCAVNSSIRLTADLGSSTPPSAVLIFSVFTITTTYTTKNGCEIGQLPPSALENALTVPNIATIFDIDGDVRNAENKILDHYNLSMCVITMKNVKPNTLIQIDPSLKTTNFLKTTASSAKLSSNVTTHQNFSVSRSLSQVNPTELSSTSGSSSAKLNTNAKILKLLFLKRKIKSGNSHTPHSVAHTPFFQNIPFQV